MRAFLTILCTFLLLGTIASAWPWSNYGELLGNGLLDKRADSNTTTSASTSEQTTTVASQTSTGSTTDTKTASDQTTGGTSTGTSTGTTTGKSDTKTAKSTTTSSISINPADAEGGISLLTPDSTTTTYYKIGEKITFVWNYTSLSVSPTAVDVVASCSLDSMTYTVTRNMSMEPTGTAIWDTSKYEGNATVPLLTASYTLFIYDADKSLSDTASAGYLGSNVGYAFGMYYTQSPTSLNGFFCVTCNGAMSEMQRQGLKFVVGMALITFLSFTWFAGTFGLFSL
ncbi:uncharacterized protein N7483_005701 [Penicillium malachiteum]|uniref:uncharacterized protein n=1 Tax=Penicillium malachiteum TaxID=1324776 RepID=UPI00254779A1|nr:uncharacterized protein N7483_005701 [Penicillium malachiteum]KAJ5731193.1 hypothetical protein N7483_005701 [Penicillium malachiteum]